MGKFVDNLVAFRVLYLLVTPFESTDAYKLGIIDKDGNQLKKLKDLKTEKEKDAYTNLHKLVFNLKKLIEKVPMIGKNRLTTFAAAYWLIKESYEKKLPFNEAKCMAILNKNITFVEEEILVEKYFKENGIPVGGVDAGTIPNVTGHAVSTDIPAIKANVPGTPLFRRLKKKLKEVK